LENEEDREIMFSGATCTNASAMAPCTNEGLDAANSDNDDVEEVPLLQIVISKLAKEVLPRNPQ
jgi:hypothetical protein